MRGDKSTILIFIIILFHAVGLAGFAIDTLQPFFLQIVPFHLLLMLAMIFLSHQDIDPKFVLFIIVISITAFGVEWLGVNRHLLFGHYVYGQTLGYKWQSVPVIIAVNWLLLTYSTGTVMQNLNVSSVSARIIIGAFVMMTLDIFIEPSATRYDYWHWTPPGEYLTAPLGNYLSWFGVSAVMLGVFEAFRFKKQNAVSGVLLLAQFVFFLLLYWV
ncbi:carotenoid biosynthesis protein [Mucilaginibacter sp. AW1-3]